MSFPGSLLTSKKNDTANRLFNVAMTRTQGKFILVANKDYLFLPILSSPKSLILWTCSLNSYLKNRAKSDEQSLYLVLNSQKWV